MFRIIFLTLLFAVFTQVSFSQYYTNQNKVWAFGTHAGVDFGSGTPVSITTTINTSEGCASIASAATGALLFYTDGHTVWNNTGAIMTGGTTIATFNTSSTSQGALIVPVIANPNQYYIFSLESVFSGTGWCHLQYCIVDMTLSGGLGAVITSTIGTAVTASLGEKITAIPGNNCDIWVVTHRKDSTKFLAYNITSAGFSSTPVVSTVGTFTAAGSYGAYGIGVLKASPDRSKIVTQCYNPGGTGCVGTELYDFNPTTGVVSNCRVLDSIHSEYGAEFSPNSSNLHYS